MHIGEQGKHGSRNHIQAHLEILFQEITNRKCEEKYQCHDSQEDGDSPDRMGHELVHPVRGSRLLILIKQAFLNYFLYVIIFFIDNLFLIIPWQDLFHMIQRVVAYDYLIKFQELDGMPAHVIHIAVFFPEGCFNPCNPALHLFTVMDHHALGPLFIMMHHCMHQHIQPCPPSGRHRNNRDFPQHFRQAVHVYLHSPLFHDIHHVKGQDDRFFQFNELHGKI